MKILVIDVGGTHVKLKLQVDEEVRKCPSGPGLTPPQLLELVRAAAAGALCSGASGAASARR